MNTTNPSTADNRNPELIRCVAIDDEPIALSIIRRHCERYGNITLETFTSATAGMDFIKRTRPHIVFMDIELNGHNGLSLARCLPDGVVTVLTTAYAEYALEGFEIDAADFLHKPIFYPRFSHAVDKARKLITASAIPNDTPGAGFITLRVEHRNTVLALSDIVYVEAMDNYVKVYRQQQPMVMSQITMKQMEEMLPPSMFARVHRSYIVALGRVESYTHRHIQLRGVSAPIPVGRKYAAKQLFTKHSPDAPDNNT